MTELAPSGAGFPQLDDDQLAIVASLGERRSVHAGEVLFSPADAAYDWIVLLTASAEILGPGGETHRAPRPSGLPRRGQPRDPSAAVPHGQGRRGGRGRGGPCGGLPQPGAERCAAERHRPRGVHRPPRRPAGRRGRHVADHRIRVHAGLDGTAGVRQPQPPPPPLDRRRGRPRHRRAARPARRRRRRPPRRRHRGAGAPAGHARRPSPSSSASPSTPSRSAATTSWWSAPDRRGWPPRSTPRRRASGRSPWTAPSIGGQAASSSRIENYLGFPTGISGQDLTTRAALQALKFGAVITSPCAVTRLDLVAGHHTLTLTDGSQVAGRAVVAATGAHYRKLPVPDLDRYEMAGVYYAATELEARACAGLPVLVVGGGNSAGQAAMFLAEHATSVCIAVRRPLAETMSTYLVERIELPSSDQGPRGAPRSPPSPAAPCSSRPRSPRATRR